MAQQEIDKKIEDILNTVILDYERKLNKWIDEVKSQVANQLVDTVTSIQQQASELITQNASTSIDKQIYRVLQNNKEHRIQTHLDHDLKEIVTQSLAVQKMMTSLQQVENQTKDFLNQHKEDFEREGVDNDQIKAILIENILAKNPSIHEITPMTLVIENVVDHHQPKNKLEQIHDHLTKFIEQDQEGLRKEEIKDMFEDQFLDPKLSAEERELIAATIENTIDHTYKSKPYQEEGNGTFDLNKLREQPKQKKQSDRGITTKTNHLLKKKGRGPKPKR